ncbi:MAG: hypothetical protein ACK5KU_09010 [Beutenbergiaceae bacterium]
MAGTEAPQWLLSAWRRSVTAVGASASRTDIEQVGNGLIERWSAQERVHHNLKRLIGVLARVDELAPETHNPEVVRLAAWYHGAVFTSAAQQAYAHKGGVDAGASAALARQELAGIGVPTEVIERVVSLVRALSRHVAPADDIDAQALCDADLGGLAAEPQRYEEYRREVRAEYAHIPDRDYVEARIAIITRLLQRRQLFTSPLGQGWEDRARDNLNAELARLEAELATLPERGEGDESALQELIADKLAHIDASESETAPTEPSQPAPSPRTAADRVDLARRAAQERANERRAAAESDRERRRQEKQERAQARAREREQARNGTHHEDDGSSMSRPPSL